MRSHTLTALEGRLAICRLDAGGGVPDWFRPRPPISSLVLTGEELSLVLPEEQVPEGQESEGGWSALRVEGPFELHTSFGVIAGVTTPLAAARVSVLSISTYDTDYLLVQSSELERAAQALTDAGHEVRSEADSRGSLEP
jgi:hypothetical protein